MPVRPLSSSPFPVRVGLGSVIALGPLPTRCFCQPFLSSCLRSPLGSFDPAGSLRSARFEVRELASPVRPITLRSLLKQVFFFARADHRSGPATNGEARCSVNLLEPLP